VSFHSQPGMGKALQSYFQKLDAALGGLPQSRREQLVAEIREHVKDAIVEQSPASEAELRDLLDRVGTPEDIAAAAVDEEDLPAPIGRPGDKLLIAIVTLFLMGGLAVGLIFAFVVPPPSGQLSSTVAIKPHPKIVSTTTPPTTTTTTPPTPTTTTTTPPTTTATTTTVPLTTTTTTPAGGPTLATCTAAVANAAGYIPPMTWGFANTISQAQSVGYACENQGVLQLAMMNVATEVEAPTPAEVAAGAMPDGNTFNSSGLIFVPQSPALELWQAVCDIEPRSTLCINGG
jgi:hypothetical protein